MKLSANAVHTLVNLKCHLFPTTIRPVVQWLNNIFHAIVYVAFPFWSCDISTSPFHNFFLYAVFMQFCCLSRTRLTVTIIGNQNQITNSIWTWLFFRHKYSGHIYYHGHVFLHKTQMFKGLSWQHEFVTPLAHKSFSINTFTAVANSSAFWTIRWSLDLLINFCETNYLAFPLIPSTIPFPWKIAKFFQANEILHLMESIFTRYIAYLLLNWEEKLLLYITSRVES